MNDKQLKSWSTIRAKGKTSYILKLGIITFGLVASSIASLILHYWSPVEVWYIRPIINLVIFSFFGYLISRQAWNKNEKAYLENNQ